MYLKTKCIVSYLKYTKMYSSEIILIFLLMLKKVAVFNIVVETVMHLFRILWWLESSKEQYLFEIEIFCETVYMSLLSRLLYLIHPSIKLLMYITLWPPTLCWYLTVCWYFVEALSLFLHTHCEISRGSYEPSQLSQLAMQLSFGHIT